MRRYIAYLKYVLRHKWFVLIEAWKLRIPWRGLIHDWHKLLPGELLPYARYFYNPDGSNRDIRTEAGHLVSDVAFDVAWLTHQRLAKHHWQYWILHRDDGSVEPLRMPLLYIKEMVADWRGAGRAQGKPNTLAWYEANKDKMSLHPESRKVVEDLLGYNANAIFIRRHILGWADRYEYLEIDTEHSVVVVNTENVGLHQIVYVTIRAGDDAIRFKFLTPPSVWHADLLTILRRSVFAWRVLCLRHRQHLHSGDVRRDTYQNIVMESEIL